MVCENDEVVAAVGADGESAHVVGLELANGIYPNRVLWSWWWGEVALAPLLRAALWSWWIKHLVANVLCDLGGFLWGKGSTWMRWRR